MFTEFANQTWTPSDASVVVTNNTDTSIDGSSKKVVWTAGTNRSVTISYDSVTLSNYEEVSFHVYMPNILASNVFTISIGGQTFTFNKDELKKSCWNHILIDCSDMSTPSTSMVITSLVPNLTIFVDYIGYRKVTYNCDIDIITALKNHIILDYDVTTSLDNDLDVGDERITLTSWAYINENTVLEIDNGSDVETVTLISRDGTEGMLSEPVTYAFSEYDEVRAICPVRSEDYDEVEPDPICGIKVFDMSADKNYTIMKAKNNSKLKEYLGALGVMIYIDCSHKKKLLQMAREFNKKYGKEFQFLLDGEQVEIYLESTVFTDDMIGNNPRMAYYYRIEPQAYLYAENPKITTLTLSTEVKAVEDVP